MRKIAILNQKGGVGKTTTSVNLAAALASIGKTVCVIDMDPQAHATLHLGVNTIPGEPSVYNVLTGTKTIREVCRQAGERLFVVGSDIDLAAAEVELAGVVGRELILRDQFALEELPFDYVIIDCPPSLGVLTINALSAVDEVYIPLQPHFLALHGLSKLLETTHLVSKRLNPKLTLGGVLLCLYEAGTKLATEIASDVVDFLDRSRQDNTPWAHSRVFTTRIRRNIRVAEAPSFGQSILEYAPNSHGALDYLALAQEILDANAETDARNAGLVASDVRSTLPLPSAEQYLREDEPVAAAPVSSRKSEGVSFAFKKVMSKRA
ncbi:MAG TPA: AAA family ATPase [Pirellulales bacterium]